MDFLNLGLKKWDETLFLGPKKCKETLISGPIKCPFPEPESVLRQVQTGIPSDFRSCHTAIRNG
jgi:hypothetical protein